MAEDTPASDTCGKDGCETEADRVSEPRDAAAPLSLIVTTVAAIAWMIGLSLYLIILCL